MAIGNYFSSGENDRDNARVSQQNFAGWLRNGSNMAPPPEAVPVLANQQMEQQKYNNALGLQNDQQRSAMNLQEAKQVGEYNLQGLVNRGAIERTTLDNQGAYQRQGLANSGALARQGMDNSGAYARQQLANEGHMGVANLQYGPESIAAQESKWRFGPGGSEWRNRPGTFHTTMQKVYDKDGMKVLEERPVVTNTATGQVLNGGQQAQNGQSPQLDLSKFDYKNPGHVSDLLNHYNDMTDDDRKMFTTGLQGHPNGANILGALRDLHNTRTAASGTASGRQQVPAVAQQQQAVPTQQQIGQPIQKPSIQVPIQQPSGLSGLYRQRAMETPYPLSSPAPIETNSARTLSQLNSGNVAQPTHGIQQNGPSQAIPLSELFRNRQGGNGQQIQNHTVPPTRQDSGTIGRFPRPQNQSALPVQNGQMMASNYRYEPPDPSPYPIITGTRAGYRPLMRNSVLG